MLVSTEDWYKQYASQIAKKSRAVSVLCGLPSVQRAFEHNIAVRGFQAIPKRNVTFLLDAPHGYAICTLECMERVECSKAIVVTWNSCPEYVMDLQELRPGALLLDEFFLRQDSDAALAEVINRVNTGGYYNWTPGAQTTLTPSERAVLRRVAHGWSNQQISERLYIGQQTVKNRLRSVYKKLGVCNHTQAALYYWQLWKPAQ